MKLKNCFITYETDGLQYMVAAGESINTFRGLVRSNETAAEIVNCLKQDTTPHAIADRLCTIYDAPRETVKADVLKILSQLRSIGALDE